MRARCLTVLSLAVGGTLLLPGVPAARAAATPIGHVFVVNFENKGFATTWGESSPAQYLTQTLRKKAVFLSEYYAIAHPSLPNYVAQISGQGPSRATQSDCPAYTDFRSTGTGEFGQLLGDGCVFPATVKTIADQLTTKGFTWKSYQEDIGNSAHQSKTCRHPDIGKSDPTVFARSGDQYTTRHNPFMYFHSVIDSPTCDSNVVGLDALSRDLRATATTPNYSYITPNLCNSGHDRPCVDGSPGGLVAADAWLRTWVPEILASPAYKRDGMLVITFDEAESDDSSGCCGALRPPNVDEAGVKGDGGGRVGALVLSPLARRGKTNKVPYNHYALLCSVENVFGLEHLGYAAQPGLACFGSDVYKVPPPTP